VNKDGYPDLIAGAYEYNNETGRAYVFSGQDGSILYTFTGENENDAFGFSVSKAGDVNKDSYADVIVGAYKYSSSATGRAYVYSGQNGSVIHSIDGDFLDFLGSSVSDLGDVNKDEYADFIVGA